MIITPLTIKQMIMLNGKVGDGWNYFVEKLFSIGCI